MARTLGLTILYGLWAVKEERQGRDRVSRGDCGILASRNFCCLFYWSFLCLFSCMQMFLSTVSFILSSLRCLLFSLLNLYSALCNYDTLFHILKRGKYCNRITPEPKDSPPPPSLSSLPGGSNIGKLGNIDRTIPYLRWVSKNPCSEPVGWGQGFFWHPTEDRGLSDQCHLVLLLLYP